MSAGCVPVPTRVWIDRPNIAAAEAAHARGDTFPVFTVWLADGRKLRATRVSWAGATKMVFDPSSDAMKDNARAWIETTGPVMVDGLVYRPPSSCELPERDAEMAWQEVLGAP